MILGIGSDLVDIRRIAQALQKHGDRFLHRLFTSDEQMCAPLNAHKAIAFWAKRFAAKEACFKALGVGRGFGFFWHDVRVLQHPTGQPFIECSGRVQVHLNHHCASSYHIHVSLADEPPFAQAFVVIENKGVFQR